MSYLVLIVVADCLFKLAANGKGLYAVWEFAILLFQPLFNSKIVILSFTTDSFAHIA